MPVDYSTTVLTQRLQKVIDNIDAGPSNGSMFVTDAGGNTLVSFQLSRPSGVASAGVINFNGLSLIAPAAAATGTAALAGFQDSNGTVVAHGLAVGTDIFFTPSNNIVAGQTVAITAASIIGN